MTSSRESETVPRLSDRVLPMTGGEYLDSLRDGRAVHIYGESVSDVTAHPAFRNSARSIAGLYDLLHDPAAPAALRTETDTGNGGFTHPFFRTARSSADLVRCRDAIVAWQRPVFGWMGRTPDYKAALLGTLGANAGFYGPFESNALAWYARCQERLLYLNHALVHPPVDRDNPAGASDVYVRVERETDAGLRVSGAKVVATNSALTNATFVAHYSLPVRDKRFGLVFVLPMETPGVKLFCRPSYEMQAAVTGSPFDHPLASRFDENDAIFVLDNVLVPWENVLIYDSDADQDFVNGSGFLSRFTFHGCTRLAVKLDFLAGCVARAVEVVGSSGLRGVQAQIGELLNWRDMFWGLSDAMAKSPTPWVNGAVQPNTSYGLSYRTLMGIAYPRVKEIVQQVLGSGLIYLNSHAADWANPEIRPYLDRYVRGSGGVAAVDRVKLLKLLWDAVGTEFAGRHELYERNYGGDHETVRLQTFKAHQASGELDRLMEYAGSCMADYDLAGWRRPDLIGPDDVRSPLVT